ncbi:MAG: nucleoside transporter family [Lasallia pustulata]|uniref:Nucleoside transporter family n=1 Tax=Lasallia pustulata TaxID=136370 RepID=A0A5M8PS45_9LECA|nr:MAG: nucleoside transporter family [Lasallia pustulata]
MLALAAHHATAHYPRRILAGLALNILAFSLLALSTAVGDAGAAGAYFAFLMLVVGVASLATGLAQNGVFAYVAAFGERGAGGGGGGRYMQGIMTGQAVAGVLPCAVQIVAVLAAAGGKGGGGRGARGVFFDGGGGGGGGGAALCGF